LRFSKSQKPRYQYEPRKAKRSGEEVIVRWCIGTHPAPRHVGNPAKDTCPEWRDICGRNKDEAAEAARLGKLN
jgi:hypothetical protein